MLGFPFDSQLDYDPETGEPLYDRAVSSQPLRKLIRELFTTGVMPNPSTNLQVSAGTDGMTVQINTGFAVIDGGLCHETEVRTLEVTAADNTYDRIDTVVLRWNENVDVRTADLYVVAGTPAANPVRPELQRDNSIYEIGLADVFVTKRVATITNDKITDTRYEAERCGIVSSVSEWDTTTIYQQVQADLAEFKTGEESDFATWSTAQQAAFEDWFETIRGILDEDVAGHLQLEIEALQGNVGSYYASEAELNADWENIPEGGNYYTPDPTEETITALQVACEDEQGNDSNVQAEITRLSTNLAEVSEKVGGGMKCIKDGKVTVNSTIDLSEFNIASKEDYFVILDTGKSYTINTQYQSTVGNGAYIENKTATSFDIKIDALGSALTVGYQVIQIR